MRITAKDLKKKDIIENKYEVIWTYPWDGKNKFVYFDVREIEGIVKKAHCPPGKTFNVSRND